MRSSSSVGPNSINRITMLVVGLCAMSTLSCGDTTPVVVDPPGDGDTDVTTFGSGIVGQAGGQVTTADGKLTLTIPAGAMDGSETISLEAVTPPARTLSVEASGTGFAIRMLPAGQSFEEPVSITISASALSDVGISDASTIGVVHYSTTHAGLEVLPATIAGNGDVTVELQSFSVLEVVHPERLTWGVFRASWTVPTVKWALAGQREYLSENEVQNWFNAWTSVSGLAATKVADPTEAHIVVRERGGHSSSDCATGPVSNMQIGGLACFDVEAREGDEVLDDSNQVTVFVYSLHIGGSCDNLLPCTEAGIREIGTHEVGHALGVAHPWRPTIVGGKPMMRPTAKSPFVTGLHPWDISAIQHLYGEPSTGGGTVLGTGFGSDQFSLIPAGTFQMGSTNGDSDEPPVHTVTLTNPFYMQKTEVTQSQWRTVMGSNPSIFSGCGADCPVENVSWYDVQDFINRLNAADPGKGYRMPTEAEWEYAARAGTTGDYGGNGSPGDMGWYRSNSGSGTHSVAQKRANSWGLYDMYGNVWEWAQDWYSFTYYGVSPSSNPPGPSTGTLRIIRGGAWYNFVTIGRSADRGSWDPGDRPQGVGFRLARTP